MQHMSNRRINNAPRQRRDMMPPSKQHSLNMEIINFIVDAWNQVSRDYKNKSSCMPGNIAEGPMVVSYYQPPEVVKPEVDTLMAGFRAVDLEQLWGRRMVDLQNRSS